MKYDKISFLLVFITLLLLCLSIVSATDSVNDTTSITKEKVSATQDVIKDTNKIATDSNINKTTTKSKNIAKTTKDNTKTAGKTPVSFNITIRNNIVNNSTIEIGVIDYSTNKAIANSALNIELPNKTKINTKTLKSGYVNVTMALPYGKNTVKIKYNGTSKYYDYDYNLNLDVVKRKTDMKVNVDGSNATGKVNLTIDLSDTATGNPIKNEKTQVSISDGRTLTQNTNSNGKTIYHFELGNGKQYLNITYGGSKTNAPAKANFTCTIKKVNVKDNVNFDIVFQSLYVGNTSFDLTLRDSTTNKALPNTQVQVQVLNGKTYTGKTDKTGTLKLNIGVPVGKNFANITYAGNANYNKHSEKINFTVRKRESSLILSVINQSNTYKIKAKLTDNVFNKALANTQFTLTLPNKNTVTLKTDKNGIAYYAITPQEGNKVYKAVYNGNANLTNSSYTLTVKTPKTKIPVTFNVTVKNNIYKNDSIVFTLINTKTKKTISKAPLTIKLPQSTVNAITNNKGEVTIKSNMSVGTNKVGISYAGNDEYESRSANVTIKISKRPSTISSNIKVTDVLSLDLNLTDKITNKGIGNAKIVLKHPKRNVTLTTNSYGKLTEDVVLPAGRANITAQFLGNSEYDKSNILTSTITIEKSQKKPAKVSLSKVSGTVGEKITLKATVKNLKGYNINGGTVVFKLNGDTLKTDNTFTSTKADKKISVKNGTASVTITATKGLKDKQNITAVYSGSSKYFTNTSNVVKAQIQLRKAKVTVTTSPKIQDQRKSIKFTVKIKDITKNKSTNVKNNKNSYVTFKINNALIKNSASKVVKVKVVNSTATYNYVIPPATAGVTTSNKVKNYVLTATYYNPDYVSAKNTTTYHVKKSATKFNITKTEYAKKTRTLTIVGKLKDYKNCDVVGISYVTIKVNGKTLKVNNVTNYKVTNGKISLKLKVPTAIKTVTSLTLTSNNRLAYNSTKITKTIKQV